MQKHIAKLYVFISLLTTAILTTLLLFSIPAQASDQCVAPSGQGGCHATIQAAVDAALNGDRIRVLAGTYAENVIITKSVTLLGGFDDTGFTTRTPRGSIVDGSGLNSVMQIRERALVTIDGFTITGGDGTANNGDGGGIAVQNATVNIINNLIENNVASSNAMMRGRGGGVFIIDSNRAVRIQDNTIRNNIGNSASGEGWGGGIAMGLMQTVTISSNVVVQNTGAVSTTFGRGGGIFSSGTTTITLNNNQILQNVALRSGADGQGGGVYLDSFSRAEQHMQLIGNQVMSNTAGITITGSTEFGGPFASGGGIRIWGSDAPNVSLIMRDNHLIGNVTAHTLTTSASTGPGHAQGGGISVARLASISMNGDMVRANKALASGSSDGSIRISAQGGGIHIDGWNTPNDSITLQRGHVLNNVAIGTVTAVGSQSDAVGGGLSIHTISTTHIISSEVRNNIAVESLSVNGNGDGRSNAFGGGIRLTDNDDVTVDGNKIQGNVAAQRLVAENDAIYGLGGGIDIFHTENLTITDNTITDNIAAERFSASGTGGWIGRPAGGGVHAELVDVISITDNDIRNNMAVKEQTVTEAGSTAQGGGINLKRVQSGVISRNIVIGNSAVITGSLTSNSTQNYFPNGGGIVVDCFETPDCNLSFVKNEVINNVATHAFSIGGGGVNGIPQGGGFALRFGVVSIQENIIQDNSANLLGDSGSGGAIDVNSSTVTMNRNRILGNRTTSVGGGLPAVWNWEGRLTSTNNVFARNTGGAGAQASETADPPATMIVINDTFYNNDHIGIVANNNSRVTVTNTIIYSHTDGIQRNGNTAILTGNYNLLNNVNNYAGSVTPGPHDITDQDPLFVDAAKDDFHLDRNSPAIDKGDNTIALTPDFEGDARPVDGDGNGVADVDIGVDEAAELVDQNIYLPTIVKN